MVAPHQLTALEARDKILAGTLSSVALVQSCLDRIKETDDGIKAWAYLDPDLALKQASELDEIRRKGKPVGSLHGVPVGLKDIVDTADQPTERGSPIFAGRQSEGDAALVERLRDAGAVIMGKTVTTELAFLHPSHTRNPHNLDHTPGGSSSGSAAAVAAGQVPLAVGTQTNGSVIRPASFCGVYGLKPSRGVISRRGVLQTSRSLDQIGVFGRSLDDVALISGALAAYDQTDPVSYPRPRPDMLSGATADVPIEPNFAMFDLPFADLLDEDARAGLDEVAEALGGQIDRLPSPPAFGNLVTVQNTIHEYEICLHLDDVLKDNWDLVSKTLQPVVERGRTITEEAYSEALETMRLAGDYFATFFHDYDAILTPSAPGEAPPAEIGTGNPIFSTLWTLCGLPCLTVPLLVGNRGLPIGVQLVGSAEGDDRLLRTARWTTERLSQTSGADNEVTE